jgi:uncharacterized protein YkwD
VRTRVSRRFVLASLVLALVLGPIQPARAASLTPSAYEARLHVLVNAERARHGLRRLAWTRCGAGFASRWAAQIARERTLRHQSVRRIVRACEASRAAENLAMGDVTPEGMVRLWMKSRPHRRSILDPHLTHAGLGAARDRSGRWYGAQVFLGY